jgi:hypothetical protein
MSVLSVSPTATLRPPSTNYRGRADRSDDTLAGGGFVQARDGPTMAAAFACVERRSAGGPQSADVPAAVWRRRAKGPSHARVPFGAVVAAHAPPKVLRGSPWCFWGKGTAAQLSSCMQARAHARTTVHTRVCARARMHARTHVHTRTHTHTHTHARTRRLAYLHGSWRVSRGRSMLYVTRCILHGVHYVAHRTAYRTLHTCSRAQIVEGGACDVDALVHVVGCMLSVVWCLLADCGGACDGGGARKQARVPSGVADVSDDAAR